MSLKLKKDTEVISKIDILEPTNGNKVIIEKNTKGKIIHVYTYNYIVDFENGLQVMANDSHVKELIYACMD